MEGLPGVNPANTAKSLFPMLVQPVNCPRQVIKEDGSIELIEVGLSPEMSDMFDEAEALFLKGRYLEAIPCYQKIIDRFPDCHLAYAHLGDSHFKMKQYRRAIGYFDQAIELNPFDHRTFLYKADALMYLDRLDEAKAAYIHALSLRPRYWLALANLQHQADKLGVEVRTNLFEPKVFVRKEADGIGVYISDQPSLKIWLIYALVKAVWLGEPSHREYHTGSSAPGWSVLEETEALLALATVYKSLKLTGDAKPDPKLDLLEKIIETGDLPYFIGYEIASRMSRHVTLTVDEEARQGLREFIAKYVVVSVPQDEQPGDTGPKVAASVKRPGESAR
jgi:tetratricopeptide (TPR) repeat protein